MFTTRDQNRLPAAPVVKIPTLSSPSGGTAVGSTYAPSLSLRRRFGPSPLPMETREAAINTRQTPVAELEVHEYDDAPSATVESPPSPAVASDLTDRKRENELDKVEDVTALNISPRGSVSLATNSATNRAPSTGACDESPQGEFLLQKEEFLERLVQRVRASCASVMEATTGAPSRDGEELDGQRQDRRRSPAPRRPSPPAVPLSERDAATQQNEDKAGQFWGNEAEEVVPRARAPSRSRSRSPSPLASPSFSAHNSAIEVRMQGSVRVEAAVTNTASMTSTAGLRSGATSPDPRAPSTDLFAAGGAMRSSLQHSRCSGVSRGRRSLSAERPEPADRGVEAVAQDIRVQEVEDLAEVDDFWVRAGAAANGTTRLRAGSVSSERASVSAAQHPQWAPHPVSQSRPAWNQRQPPKKQRPVVSAPAGNPPPPPTSPSSSSRRGVSRSPERAAAPRLGGRIASTQTATSPLSFWGPHHSAERALRRSASLPTAPLQQQQSPAQERYSATAPRPTANSVTKMQTAALDNTQVMSEQSPIEGPDATTSPPSPPSARALFQSIEVDSATRTTPPCATGASAASKTQPLQTQQESVEGKAARRSPPASPSVLQQTCEAALERATRAEKQCNVLTLALEQLLVEHVAEKAEWQTRVATLEQQLTRVTQWISSIDAEADLSTVDRRAAPSPTPQAVFYDPAARRSAAADTNVAATSVQGPQPSRDMVGKRAVWEAEEEEEAEISSHHGSGGSVGRSANLSPLPGVPGATPTPARRDGAGADSRGTSMCQARLPPSPPMILHLHAQQ